MEEQLDLIDSIGWKGVGKTEIVQQDSDKYILRCWHKSKQTGENYSIEHEVPKQNVDVLLNLIQTYQPRVEYKPKHLFINIVDYYKLGAKENMPDDILVSVFTGGKLRSKYYFPYYYYPMKILEEMGHIIYNDKSWVWTG